MSDKIEISRDEIIRKMQAMNLAIAECNHKGVYVTGSAEDRKQVYQTMITIYDTLETVASTPIDVLRELVK